MAENLTPKKYIDSNNMKQILTAVKNDIPTTVAELTDSSSYAKKTDIPTTLPANGGNADTVNNHTVKSDVPENAVFTDTIYDDTTVQGAIDKVNANLGGLEFGQTDDGKWGYKPTGADTVIPFKSGELEDTGKIYGRNGRIKLMKMENLRYFDSVAGDFIETGMDNIVLDEEDRPLSNTTIKGAFTGNGRDWTNGTIVIGTNGKLTLSKPNNYFSFANCHWIAKS